MAQLDFYFDYACPWCYMGAHTVRELAAEGVEIRYHVWKMPKNATPPPKPEGYREAAGVRLKELREELNIPVRSPLQGETVPALIATKVATEMGKAAEFVEATFRAQWAEKQDISQQDTLVEIAASVGLDAAAFREALVSGAGRAAFEADLAAAEELEIDTIPAYLNEHNRLLIHHFNDMPTLDQLREISR